jgi:hypothetical protein
MKSIKDIIKNKSGRLPPTRTIDEKTLIFVFEKVIKEEMGAMGKEKLRAKKFSNRTVFVRTESSAWASELWLNRNKIINRINDELGQEIVAKIKVN